MSLTRSLLAVLYGSLLSRVKYKVDVSDGIDTTQPPRVQQEIRNRARTIRETARPGMSVLLHGICIVKQT
jgi:hypothetical protein